MMLAYADSGTNLTANQTVSEFVKGKIRQILKDPAVAELLMPDHICMQTPMSGYQLFPKPTIVLM